MRLHLPTFLTFGISLILFALALVSRLHILDIPDYIPNQPFWLIALGYIVLLLGNLVPGL
jgi:hypothetical protein